MALQHKLLARLQRNAIDGAAAVKYSFQTPKRIILTTSITLITSVLFILLIAPSFSYELLTQDITYLEYALTSLIRLEYAEHGRLGLALLSVYALLVGVLSTTVLGRVRLVKQETSEDSQSVLPAVFSTLPGLVLAGCASCGAGLFGLLGIYGTTALLPFGGLGLRAIVIALLLVVLVRTGDPRICRLK